MSEFKRTVGLFYKDWKKVAPTKLTNDELLQTYVIAGLFSLDGDNGKTNLNDRWKEVAARCRREILKRM